METRKAKAFFKYHPLKSKNFTWRCSPGLLRRYAGGVGELLAGNTPKYIMENLKHTPGPWEADTDLMHPIITGPDGANHGPTVGGESGDFIIAKFFGPDADANARLCVGAVEMKKTLESTVEALDYSIHWMDNDSPAKRKVEMSRDSAIALLARLTKKPPSNCIQLNFS